MLKNKKIKVIAFAIMTTFASGSVMASHDSIDFFNTSPSKIKQSIKNPPIKNVGKNDLYRSVNPKSFTAKKEQPRYSPVMLTLHDANMNQ